MKRMLQRKDAAPLTPDEVLAKVEQFCAYRERSPKEVRQKIHELGIRGETADQIFEVLQGDGFFNEERFALAFAGGKFRINQWGRVRIRLELQQRGIGGAMIREALAAIDESDYHNTLQHLADKKLQQLRNDPQARQKTAAYLIRTGFEPELVFQVLE